MNTTSDQLEKAVAWFAPGRHMIVLSPVDVAELEDVVPALIADVKTLVIIEKGWGDVSTADLQVLAVAAESDGFPISAHAATIALELDKRLRLARFLLWQMRQEAGLDTRDCAKPGCRRCAVLRDVDAFLGLKEIDHG